MKQVLSERQLQILTILSHSDEPLSSAVLAAQLSLSVKTIQSEVAQINRSLPETPIYAIRGKGYRLKEGVSFDQLSITKSNSRKLSILRELLMNEKVSYYALADQLFISTSTLNKDIQELNQRILRTFPQLQILRKNNMLYLNCDAEKRKKVLTFFLLEESENASFDIAVLEHCFDALDVGSIREALLEYIALYHYQIADFELFSILLHVLIECSEEGELQEPSSGFARFLYEKGGWVISASASQKIESFFDEGHVPSTKDDRYRFYQNFLRQIFQEIYDIYTIDLQSDEKLMNSLNLHLQSLERRVCRNAQLKNPLLPQFRSGFVLVYDIAVYIASRFYEIVHQRLAEDEISYLAMHILIALQKLNNNSLCIAVVNPFGNAVETYLRQRISAISNVTICGNFSFLDYKGIAAAQPDLVLTLVSLAHQYPFAVYQIHDYLDERAYRRVEALVRRLRVKKTYQNLLIRRCFYETLFLPQQVFSDKEAAIDAMCAQLYAQGFVDASFREKVYEREALAPTCFSDTFAIPHATHKIALKSGICVAVLKEPVEWNGFSVRLIFLFALSPQFDQIPKLYELLLNMLDDRERYLALLQVQHFADFLALLFPDETTPHTEGVQTACPEDETNFHK